jgi:hypothetical protein
MSSSLQVADYSAALQYLTAVAVAGSPDADGVRQHMRQMRINDVFATNGYIRDDGRMVHDMYLLQVKSPDQSKQPSEGLRMAIFTLILPDRFCSLPISARIFRSPRDGKNADRRSAGRNGACRRGASR